MGHKRMVDSTALINSADIYHMGGLKGLLFYQLLWSWAEAFGGYAPDYDDMVLKSGVLVAYEKIDVEWVKEFIKKLIASLKIIPYEIEGKEYHWIASFNKYQDIGNPSTPKIPPPPWITYVVKRWPSGKKYVEYTYNDVPDKGKEKGKRGKSKVESSPDTEKLKYGEHHNIFLTEIEFKKLIEKYGEPATQAKIEYLSNQIGNIKKYNKYTDHYRTLNNWLRTDQEKKSATPMPPVAKVTPPSGPAMSMLEELEKEKQGA